MSFETPGWGVAPPALTSSAAALGAKRKRPSEGVAAAVEASTKGSNINLDKLMAAMEKEERESKGVAVAKGKEKKDKKDKKSQDGGVAEKKAGGGAPGAGGPGGQTKKPFEAKKPYDKKEKKESKKRDQPTTITTTDSPKPAPQQQQPPKKKEPKPQQQPKQLAPGEVKMNKRDQRKAKAAAAAAAAAGGPLPVPLVPTTSTAAASPPSPPGTAKTPKASKVATPPAASTSGGNNTVVMAMDEDLPARKELLEAGLTPMQAKMKGRLEGARFRWINEQLYTTSSTSALEMMKADPSIFADYHTGFRHQAHSWPQSPLSLLLTSLSATLSASSSLIIDLGCGDAELAKTLVPQGYKVLSYDLVTDDWVAEADFCEKIPLPGGEAAVVDAAVCCLSLMGRNWIGGVREVARVLKEGGTFEIAEITSRMPSVEAFIAMVVSLGFRLKKKDASNTHFMMLSFAREGEVSWDEGGSLAWEDVLKKGEEVLKACVYKKR